MTVHRRPVYFNPEARSWTPVHVRPVALVKDFQQHFKSYQKSSLLCLKSLAEEINVGAVYLKDETTRLGSPGFLGTSWWAFRSILNHLRLELDSTVEVVKARASEQHFSLFAATRGPQAQVATQVGALLGIPVIVYVPSDLNAENITSIKDGGATVIETDGDYHAALSAARIACKEEDGVFVHEETELNSHGDNSAWFAEGYRIVMSEIEEQLHGLPVDCVISPVGANSLSQAAITHFKAVGESTSFVAVESDTAGCLWKSLSRCKASFETTDRSAGSQVNDHAASLDGWETLMSGIDACLTISDYEAYLASNDLVSNGIVAGHSGAVGVAALRRLGKSGKDQLGLDERSVIVILGTECREADAVPKDVASDDVVSLTQTLIQIDSSNPESAGPGEGAIARYIKAWLEHRGVESHWVEPTAGRPSVIGVVRGSGGGKSLMFNGHTDTVTLQGYNGDPLSAIIKDGSIYGRGAADMKSGLAAAMVALVNAKGLNLRGDVILAAVADEEMDSIGTEQVLKAGWRADAAIIAEPTEMAIIHSHKGYALFEVDVYGVAAHGSRADLGVDAICKAGYFLVELDRHAWELQNESPLGSEAENGVGNIHCGVIKGGEEINSYPAGCTISIERRTVAGETDETVRKQLLSILNRLAATVADFKFDLRTTFARSPFFIARDHPFVNLVANHATECIGSDPIVRAETYWTDMALLSDVGIPGVIWGPKGYGLHAKTEWVETESIRQLTDSFVAIEADFCK